MNSPSAPLWMLTCACLCSLAEGGYAPRVGEPHPDFVLPDIVDGTPVSLSQYRGKKVLVFHFASW